jgi:CheY-like chemotaxis protein
MEQVPDKIKVLFVDDDPLILRIYRDSLARHGLHVEIAADGLAAVKALRTARPDMVVLDLMMPKFSGVDVIKFIRSQKNLDGLPVILLSNSYMDELANEAIAAGVQKALLKVRCTPSLLAGIIKDLAAGRETLDDPSYTLPVPKNEPATPRSAPPPSPASAPPAKSVESRGPDAPPSAVQASPPPPVSIAKDAIEFMTKAREDFLSKSSATIAALRSLEQGVSEAATPAERSQALEVFYRKAHFLSAIAGLGDCHAIARMASAFEALLFELMEKPEFAGPSVLRTIASTVDLLGVLFEQARGSNPADAPPPAQALVVDDDPISNRVIVAALRRADVRGTSTEDPLAALRLLEANHYDLILLDIEMPNMDGFELCKQIRALPGHANTPVIYVTGHSDFDHRAKSILSGGNDLISKPVFPIELAVKAASHIVKQRL